MIHISNLSKSFSGQTVLDNLSLDIQKGEVIALIGSSGAGKSTFLRSLNYLETPDSGTISIDGFKVDFAQISQEEILTLRRKLAMVFQQFNLLESQTVYQNLKIPLIISGAPKNSIDTRIEELLDFVGLKDKKNSSVSKLSGGQKQRIGIARALATHPKILLCDEATSALDPKTTKSILQLLKKINNEFGITILLITHEMEVVKEICNKVAVMQDGEIKEQGNIIEIFTNPQENITKNFISSIINNDIPESLKEELDLNLPVVKLTFLGEKSGQPLISEINKKFDISTKILSASVNELGNTILGVLVVQLEGNPVIINEVEEFIKNRGVRIERMEII